MLRVRVDADHDGVRPHASALGSNLVVRHGDRARSVVDAGAGRDRGTRERAHVPDRVQLAVVLVDRRSVLRREPDAHAFLLQALGAFAHLRPFLVVAGDLS